MNKILLTFSFLPLLLSPCLGSAQDTADVYSSKINLAAVNKTLPLVKQRAKEIESALKSQIPVIRLAEPSAEQKLAEDIALSLPEFVRYTYNSQNLPFLTQIFGVYPAKPSDFSGVAPSNLKQFFKVELYNFALNLTTSALIDIEKKQVYSVGHSPQSQPDIPESLKQLALTIAVNAPEIIEAVGVKPEAKDALMASTKTSLNRTRCERSRHLCVAPTFVKGDRALWAIVDLTDLKVVGIRWTNVGSTGPAVITERKIQNDRIMAAYCDGEEHVAKNFWDLSYRLTSSDGLEIRNASFRGKPVLESAKLVDWHVSYSNTDGFGYSDAIGCPIFSQAAVVANSPPKLTQSKYAIVIEQEYFNQGWPAPCNYNYVQRYEFYTNGDFRVSAASIGRGCGNEATYRPVFRIAFAESHSFREFAGQSENTPTWNEWKKESWIKQLPTTVYSSEGYQFMLGAGENTYFLRPSRGQYNDGGRGDFAHTYLTKKKPGEGDKNLVTIGPCCNTDYHQGPEKFIEPNAEKIDESGFVIWYVPELKNDDRVGKEYCWAESVLVDGVYQVKTYPCFAGPLFVRLLNSLD